MAIYNDQQQLMGMLSGLRVLESAPGAAPVFAAAGIETGTGSQAAPAAPAQNWDFLKGPGA